MINTSQIDDEIMTEKVRVQIEFFNKTKSPQQIAEGLNCLFDYCSEAVSPFNFGCYVDQLAISQKANPVMLVSVC